MSYTFTKEDEGYSGSYSYVPPKTITHTVEADDADLYQLCAAFEDFLRGCGYVFDGHIEVVEDETDESAVAQGDSDDDTATFDPNGSDQAEFDFSEDAQDDETAAKVEDTVAGIVSSDPVPAAVIPAVVDSVVSNSPSADVPEAAAVVANVVQTVAASDAETHPAVAVYFVE